MWCVQGRTGNATSRVTWQNETLIRGILLQNDSLATLLARLEGILGPVPAWMLQQGRYAHRYYTHHGTLFEHSPRTVRFFLKFDPTAFEWLYTASAE